MQAHCAREVATFYSPDGKHALVLFSTNEPPRTEEYETLCERIEGGWTGLSGGGGPGGGWMSTNDDASRGVA